MESRSTSILLCLVIDPRVSPLLTSNHRRPGVDVRTIQISPRVAALKGSEGVGPPSPFMLTGHNQHRHQWQAAHLVGTRRCARNPMTGEGKTREGLGLSRCYNIYASVQGIISSSLLKKWFVTSGQGKSAVRLCCGFSCGSPPKQAPDLDIRGTPRHCPAASRVRRLT